MTQRNDGGPNAGDLRVWHIPQIPMSPFRVSVASPDEAVKVMQVLADYDIFQFENRVKPDYCNASGLEVMIGLIGGEPQWVEWDDPETGDEIDEYASRMLAARGADMSTQHTPAPDLLSALIEIRAYLSRCPPHAEDITGAKWGRVMDLSGAALNKAEGTS